MTSAAAEPPGVDSPGVDSPGGGTVAQDELDEAIRSYYGEQFDEDARIQTRSVGGQLELERTRRLVTARLAPASRVLDVGGATGAHARWLAEAGHDVTLVDLLPSHVEKASAIGTFRALVGDARALPAADASVDAVLLLGPLYHLVSRADRHRALAEAHRVLIPGGTIFAQGIGRLSAFTDAATRGSFESLSATDLHVLRTGEWANVGGGFPGGHFHTVAELRAEVEEAGFEDVELLGVEGPNVGALELIADDPELLGIALRLVERLEAALKQSRSTVGRHDDVVAEASPHLLAIARKGSGHHGTRPDAR